MNTFEQPKLATMLCPFNYRVKTIYVCINQVACRAIGFATCDNYGVYGAPLTNPCDKWQYGQCCKRDYVIHVPDEE